MHGPVERFSCITGEKLSLVTNVIYAKDTEPSGTRNCGHTHTYAHTD